MSLKPSYLMREYWWCHSWFFSIFFFIIRSI